ncbi:2,3-bisphosphoglycerate-independent phosphoglycerate mutase [hydrothermal vent metagenome]|uniref:2,3-bisphosphoglycerate-independent phosphoglycerate mutase n=1 Tax=hydrothermal vent metagenome TaxID=652676 RepID=A0A3B1A1T1_9ZZZZ
MNHKPITLLILDGYGYSEQKEGNAIAHAKTPNMDRYQSEYPNSLIQCSGASVGLPAEQMGNSEVGHLNLGAGRVVYQEYTRVNRSIKTGSFFTNQTLTDAMQIAIDNNKAVHILGLLSDGGVHSHETHIHAMAELAVKQGVREVYLHAFLDGRDTAPRSASGSIANMQEKFDRELGRGRIASIIGRFFAMDRDHRWPRIQAAYDLITQGKAEFSASSAQSGLDLAYARGEKDEFVQATAIIPEGGSAVRVEDGDVIVFMNYRSDRARQITLPFIEADFDGFKREQHPKLGQFVSLTEYKSEYDIPVAYPPDRLKNVFGEVISKLGMHQLRIAETEKYAHVTFFFNGGREEPFEFEDRILVSSPSEVMTYDQKPEMSAAQVSSKLITAIESDKYEVIICNFANPDMVGHTGNFDATVLAIEYLDSCVGKVVEAIQKAGGEVLITADHGNAEKMENKETGQAHTAHTSNLVPCVYIGSRAATMSENGALSDVAPTLIYMLGLDKPNEMNGDSLINFVTSKSEEA